MFSRREGRWERSDVTLLQRCYDDEEIVKALRAVGFVGVRTHDGARDLGEGLSRYPGRRFFVCERPEGG